MRSERRSFKVNLLVILIGLAVVAWGKSMTEAYWRSNQPEIDKFGGGLVRASGAKGAPCGGCAQE